MFEVTTIRPGGVVARATGWDDLREVWSFENDVFGDDNVSWQTLRGWWSRYSAFALHVRDACGQVVGTFDASPVHPDAFEHLVDGRWSEHDLSSECSSPPSGDEVVSHWCATSLTTRGSMAERAEILGALLSGLLERLDTLPEVGWPSRWCAFAQSAEGRRVLEHAGFHRNRQGAPMFVCDLTSAEDVHEFRARIAGAAAVLNRRNTRRSLALAA